MEGVKSEVGRGENENLAMSLFYHNCYSCTNGELWSHLLMLSIPSFLSINFLLSTLRLWKVRLLPMAEMKPGQLKEACRGEKGAGEMGFGWWMAQDGK